jgi:hypothetical protein
VNRGVRPSVFRRVRHWGWAWGSTVCVAALLFVACGGGSAKRGAPEPASVTTTTQAAPAEDANLTAADFENIHLMTRVGDHFVANVRGHLAEALAAARSPRGGDYPVGTIIQLVPQEAMVKRRAGFSPATRDWEFFSLDVSAAGTKILDRGGAEVVNRFGGSCASCHGAAKPQFDDVCGKTHGCAPLPIGDKVIAAIQNADPRPTH